jgi:hypothetical protein
MREKTQDQDKTFLQNTKDHDSDAPPCDQPLDNETHGDPFNEENVTKKLKILKKAEDQNNKMAEKASIIAMNEMKRMLANREKDMEERLAEQT